MNFYKIDKINKSFVFDFPYNEKIVKRIKECGHTARFNRYSKNWIVEINEFTIPYIKDIVKDFSFQQVEIPPEKEVKFSYSLKDTVFSELKALCDSKNFALTPRDYQIEALGFGLEKGNMMNGDDVGCIDGDAMLQINRAGKGTKIALSQLFHKFNGGRTRNRKWDLTIPTKVKSFDEDKQIFVYNTINKVLDKGVKKVLKVVLKSGKSLRLTPDHEVYTKDGWIEIQKLKVGDEIFSNGKPACKLCGSTENVVTYKQAKFLGYCKKCVNRKLKNRFKEGQTGKWIDPDGYVWVSGVYDHPRAKHKGSSVLEHILVMEKHLRRYLTKDEVVHHINHNKQDNRLENLQLLTTSEHARIHSKERYSNFDSEKLKLIPVSDEIIELYEDGEAHVYDIIMDDPHRCFVANKILVHNCGKTYESILYAEITNSFPCLVVVPSSVKYNWLEKWDMITRGQRSISVIEGKKQDWTKDVTLISYGTIGKKQGQGATVKFPELKSTDWKMVIFDEAHFLKNSKSQRSKAASKITNRKQIIQMLSGTISLSKPVEIWNLLKIAYLDHHIAGSWMEFVEKYCNGYRGKNGWVTDGATNIIELNRRLRETCYIRREKRDVMKELPECIQQVLKTDVSNLREIKRATKDFIDYMYEKYGNEAADRAAEAEHLTSINILRKLAIQGKMKALEKYLKDWKESGRKLLVFGVHREQLEYLANKFNCPLIAGGVSSKKKQQIVNDWKSSDDIFMFANIISAGTGIDGLQDVCSDAVVYELPWNPSDVHQLIGRIDRSGQNDVVSITYFLSFDTIDLQMWEMLEEKERITEAVNKGIDVERNESGFKMVMKKILEK